MFERADGDNDADVRTTVDQLCRDAARRWRPILRRFGSWWPRCLFLLALVAASYPAWRAATLATLDLQQLPAWCRAPFVP
jgi:hypothetical protein